MFQEPEIHRILGHLEGSAILTFNFKLKMNLLALFICLPMIAWAQSYSAAQLQAKTLLEKISGTKVGMNHPLIPSIVAKIQSGDMVGAAMLAESHPNFLNVTVKDMALKMSTRAETMRIPLNDFTASFMGVVQDGMDARNLLIGNFTYVADSTKLPAGVNIPSDPVADMASSNNHYAALDSPQNVNGTMMTLDIGNILKYSAGQPMALQDPPNGSTSNPSLLLMNPEPAGVLTSRSFLIEHTVAGTNRRPVEFTFREFMCSPITNWADIQVSDARVGRDVDRFPGGQNQTYLTTCKGCHSVMDGFRGAYAHFDVDSGGMHVGHGTLNNGGSFDSNGIATKMNKNTSVFPTGFVTTDTSYINNARGATNAAQFGWRDSGSPGGTGLSAFATIISNSQRFSQCMVQRVYEATCRRLIDIGAQASYVAPLAQDFESNGYNLRRLFATVAASAQCSQ